MRYLTMKSSYRILEIILLLTLLFTYGCAHVSTRHIEQGDSQANKRNFIAAAKEYLSALKYERNHLESRQRLCSVAEPAYKESLKKAEKFETASKFKKARKAFKQTTSYIEQFTKFDCVDFPVIDLNQKIASMGSAILEKHYQQAEFHFSRGHYLFAVEEYKKAARSKPYKDSNQKIAQSHFAQAKIYELQSQFREAADQYLFSHDTILNFKGSKDKANAILYSLGNYFLSNNHCRKALQDFQQASGLNPNYKDLAEKLRQSSECAIVTIAFAKFNNKTRRNIAGMSIGDFIYDQIQSGINNNGSRFLRIVDSSGNYHNADYKISGKLTQIRVVHRGLEKKRVSGIAARRYNCQHTDDNGNIYNDTCTEDVNIYYDEITDHVSVTLSGSIKAVNTRTGENIVLYNISSQMDDSIRYADIVSHLKDVELYQDLYNLVNERTHLVDGDDLVREAIAEIEKGFVKEIIQNIDQSNNLSDPTNLALYH